MYEKECEICGTYFTAVRANRKYCDRCQKNSAKAKARLDKQIIISKHTTGYYDEWIEKKCNECGKFVKMVPRSMRRHVMYCSDACKAKADERRKEAAANRPPKPIIQTRCPHCGKMFDNPYYKRMYCSNECYQQSLIEKKRVIGDIECTCKNCGKKFTYHTDKYVSKYVLPKACSVECRKELNRAGTKKAAEMARYHAEKRQKAEEEHNKKKKLELFSKNGLCAYCKTSYKDCERMQSNFRIIPNGAKFNDNGKIITCPKFKEAKIVM